MCLKLSSKPCVLKISMNFFLILYRTEQSLWGALQRRYNMYIVIIIHCFSESRQILIVKSDPIHADGFNKPDLKETFVSRNSFEY